MQQGSIKRVLLIVGTVVAVLVIGFIAFLVAFGGLKINGYARLTSPNTTGYSTFVQSKGEYSYSYPKDWKVVTPASGFESRAEYRMSETEYVNVNTFSDTNTLERQLLVERQSLQKSHSEVKYGATRKMTLNGYPTYTLDFTAKSSGNPVKGVIVFTSKGPKVYGMFLVGTKTAFDKYSSALISSFKVQ